MSMQKRELYAVLLNIKSFLQASLDFTNDRTNPGKRAKIGKMLIELRNLRNTVEDDIERIEAAVNSSTASAEITDHSESQRLIESFDSYYYELVAFADVHKFALAPALDVAPNSFSTQNNVNNMSSFQLPKRKFPVFSGVLTEWQGFEDLFKSILSHAPDFPDVERFEYLKTSLSGEPLSLISHLSLTATNYNSAWKILSDRYGNKRDLARIYLDALLANQSVKSNDAASIKTQLNTLLEHTAALGNLGYVTRQWSPLLVHIAENHLNYELRARWELVVGDNYFPQLTEFIDFLRSHLRSAEIYSGSSSHDKPDNVPKHQKPFKHSMSKFRSSGSSTVLSATTNTSPVKNCQFCNAPHSIRQCKLFTEKAPNERFLIAKTHRLSWIGPFCHVMYLEV